MPMSPEELREDEEALARKLAAAYLAHVLRVKSIDRVLKTYDLPNSEISPEWIELAKHALMIHKKFGVPTQTRRTQ
jgi:hypothetical protein